MRATTRVGLAGGLLSLTLAASLLASGSPPGGGRAGPAGLGPSSVPLPRVTPSAEPPARPGPRHQHTPAAGPPPHRHVTVVMSGDLLWHNTVWESAHEDAVRLGTHQPFDFGPAFAAMAPVVRRADLAICHEEVPFAADDAHLSSYPVFAAPPEVAPWIASMGWDACTTDSNHSIDQGFAGLVRTANLLERNGVRHVGTFRTAAERRRPVILTTRNGVRVGIVGGTYSLNGFALPPDKRWAVSMWDADNLIAQAKAAKAAGADIVLVQYHGGDEYSRLPNAEQVALVRRLTACPAVDLVFAEHVHVVQPITRVNGTWVVYGMGNMIAQMDPVYPRAFEGITVRFRFTQSRHGFRVDRAAYIPTYWNLWSPGHPIRIQRVDRALAHGAPDRARLLEARRMTRLAVNGLATRGGTTPGLRER
ncbi:CapA family protein [Nocardioides cynanchi]|uniref:CapA family protein n=1 Tax=Nocardioides cynanchi TaxID=2558918 RepID=UPI001244D507|nr:CapA family protein [Nocardioides cynanchi]